jgi:integrase
MRRGEVFARRWRDFDREAKRPWVRRSLDRYGDFHEPKSGGREGILLITHIKNL